METKIYAFLLAACGGKQNNIKGLSSSSLSKMMNGTSGISTKKLASVLKANNIVGNIELINGQTKTIIKLY